MEDLELVPPAFLAIDFETATSDMDSACALGVAIVSGLEIIRRDHFYIRPPKNEYDPKHTEIHGICPADTKNAPSAWAVIHCLVPLIEAGLPVIAHNAVFDMSVISGCVSDFPDFKYMDTMDMVRPFNLPSRSLDQCAEFFGIPLEHHHNALDDAVACAQVAIACFKQSEFDTFSDYCLFSPHVKIKQFSQLNAIKSIQPKTPKNLHAFEYVRPSDFVPTVNTIDETGPLFGKSVVFTGALSIDRHIAAQMAVDAGAIIKTSVSKKTDYLIVGMQDKTLVGEDGLSTKEERALELNASGKANIRFISEAEFMELVGRQSEQIETTEEEALRV